MDLSPLTNVDRVIHTNNKEEERVFINKDGIVGDTCSILVFKLKGKEKAIWAK
ncbi:hypothetical protein [Stygiolobus sp. CP850M]|uniref:hypothetical protein n=1 Tax=Stygiolobus sp. CP850M TaxID=3133134 RepID=UPI00307DF54A